MSFETQISNYYEKLVVDNLSRRENISTHDDTLSDIACVALNQLPSRYFRYSVDMAFYLSASENEKMENDVRKAVDYAIEFVNKHKSRS